MGLRMKDSQPDCAFDLVRRPLGTPLSADTPDRGDGFAYPKARRRISLCVAPRFSCVFGCFSGFVDRTAPFHDTPRQLLTG